MEIKQYVWDIVDANSWLVLEGDSGLLIDAVGNTDLYKKTEGLKDLTVIITHSHFDHIIGLNKIRETRKDAIVITTEKCSEYLGNIYRNMSSSATAFMQFYESGRKSDVRIEPIVCAPSDKIFKENLTIEWNDHRIDLYAVHGHSEDGLIVILDEMYMFSGDTILNIPTVTRLPSGNSKAFWMEDIPFIKGLKGIKKVYPGHGGYGNLDEMLSVNIMPKKFKNHLKKE